MIENHFLLIEHKIGLNIHETVYQKRLAMFDDSMAVPIAWHSVTNQGDKVDTLSDIAYRNDACNASIPGLAMSS
jgi:hypothetical protein